MHTIICFRNPKALNGRDEIAESTTLVGSKRDRVEAESSAGESIKQDFSRMLLSLISY